jgi:hypothetical protein
MKYTRTKDKILDMSTCYYGYFELERSIIDINGYAYFLNEIIKQSDNIEELCDEFVMFTNGNKRNIRVYKTMHSISLYTKRDKKYKGNMVEKVYSAIWTDKGLIYVAKMNDKGEWELL